MIKVLIDIEKKVLRNLIQLITSADKSVLVGIPSDAKARKKIKAANPNSGGENRQPTNAEIGYINEFGSPAQNIPARPFLGPGVTKEKDNIGKILKSYLVKEIEEPKTADKELNKAGLVAVASVKKTIVAGEGMRPISARTYAERIARRKRGTNENVGDKPLIDTGQLLNSITYVVKGNK